MSPSKNVIGRTASGGELRFDPLAGGHTVVTGQTGSGKSVTTYGIAMQIAATAQAQAVVIDPSAVLSSPWSEISGESHVSGVGPADIPRVIEVLDAVVAEMDRRTRALGASGADKVARSWFSPGFPAIWLILEEYAGLVAIARMCKEPKRADNEIVDRVGRILREGRKAGISVLTILQRPEVASLHDRGQYSRFMLHLLDKKTSVEMLLDDPDPETVRLLTSLLPGQLGYKVLGPTPMERAKAVYVDYPRYVAWVRQHAGRTRPLIPAAVTT